MIIKKWLAALKYIVPGDMEYFLEEQASEGYFLKPLGQASLLYFEFDEKISHHCRYVVDVTSLPKTMYMDTLIKKGWTYMGKSGNCYIWSMEYEGKRPEDFSDSYCIRRHCIRMGIGMLLIAIILLALIVGLIYGIYLERKFGVFSHTISYIIEAVINVPFACYFGWAAKKLLSYKP